MSALRELPHSYIKIGKRYRKDLGDLSSLADSIRTVGLIQRIVVDKNHNLIVGHRRLEAWKLAKGTAAVPCLIVDDLDDAEHRLIAERDENTCRKDMLPSEIYELGMAIDRLERPKADARARSNLKGASAMSPDTAESGRTAQKVGPALGMSPRTWDKLKAIGDAAAKGDSTAAASLAAVDAGTLTINGAYNSTSRPHPRSNAPRRPDIGAVGNLRSLPRSKSATHMLTKVCEQLDGIAHAIGTIDVAETTAAEAPAIADDLSRFRTVLSKTINSLRSLQ